MTTYLVQSSEEWLRAVMSASAKAAVLAGLALLLTVALRRWLAPQWRHLLWLLVFARLVAPDLGEWRWSAQQWYRAMAAAAPEAETGALPQLAAEMVTQGPAAPQTPPAAVAKAGERAAPVAAEAPRSFTLTTWEMLGILWAAGAVLMLGVMLACSMRFHRRVLGAAVPAGPLWRQELEALRVRNGWRRVPEILVSTGVGSPLLTGPWRPRIVLPAGAGLKALTYAQRRHLLLHEMAHVRRGDLWLQTAAAVLLAVHWFNPLVWLAGRRLRAESEACADAWVLRHEGEAQARNYGGTLLHLVAHSASVMVLLFAPGVLGMAGSGRELKERLRELALSQKRKRCWTVAALAVVGLSCALTFTEPAAAQDKAEGTKADTASIHGRVVDEAGRPVEDVKVNLWHADYASTGERVETKTDKEGRFHFDNELKGLTVQLNYSHPGYASTQLVNATAGDGGEVELVLKATLSLTGMVTDADGRPVAGARVYLGRKDFQSHSWTTGKSVLTDAEGRYRLQHREAAGGKPAVIRVESEAHATFVSDPKAFSQAASSLDVKLAPKKLLEGTVTDDRGQAVAGALVWVMEEQFDSRRTINQAWMDARLKGANGDSEPFFIKTLSDAAGKFALKTPHPVFKPVFIFAVTPDGIGRTRLTAFDQAKGVRVERWNTLKARFVLPDGRPLANAEVWAGCDGQEAAADFSFRMHRGVFGKTDDDGRFTFQQILPHSRARISGDRRETKDDVVKFAAGETQERTFTVALKEAEIAKVAGTRQVTGTVLLPAGVTLPVTGVEIEVMEAGTQQARGRAVCGKDGRFLLPAVAPGSYLISAVLRDPEAPNNVFGAAASAGFEFAFKAEPGQTKLDVGKLQLNLPYARRKTLPLPKGPSGTVKLKIEDPQGRPVSGAVVEGAMLYPDYAVVIGSDDLARIPPHPSNERGEVTLVYPRDLPGRDPIAAASVTVEKEGFLRQHPEPLTDGESVTVKLQVPPVLEVRGAPPAAELWATFLSFGAAPVKLERRGDAVAGPVPFSGTVPCMLTDQGDARRWRFATVEMVDFKSGETLVLEPKWTPGVVVNGRVTGLPTPVTGEAWAHAEVWCQGETPTDKVRPAVHMPGFRTRPASEIRWAAWCPVKADGSFHFPGVPPGRLSLQVIGQGWVMQSDSQDQGATRGRIVTAGDDEITIVQPMRPAGRKRIQVLAPDGSPAEGAVVRFYRTGAPTNNGYVARYRGNALAHVAREHREAYRAWSTGSMPGHEAKTGADGIAVMDNQPEGRTDMWVTWKDPKSGHLHRRELPVPVGPGTADPHVVDLSKGKVAR